MALLCKAGLGAAMGLCCHGVGVQWLCPGVGTAELCHNTKPKEPMLLGYSEPAMKAGADHGSPAHLVPWNRSLLKMLGLTIHNRITFLLATWKQENRALHIRVVAASRRDVVISGAVKPEYSQALLLNLRGYFKYLIPYRAVPYRPLQPHAQ